MTLFLGAALIFVSLVLGYLFFQVVKAKARIDYTLKASKASIDFVSALALAGFFEKNAAEASDATGKASYSTGKFWKILLASGTGYPAVINIESESSSRSFKVPRNAFIALSMILFVVEYQFLSITYSTISGVGFLLMSLAPLSAPGRRRALSELSALSWLVFHFYKSDPAECAKCLVKSARLKHLYEAVAVLDTCVKRGQWGEEMEAWLSRNPAATEEEQLAEARRLIDKFDLRAQAPILKQPSQVII